MILAGKERRKACPDDSTWMDKKLVKGIVMDKCMACGGVWLDPGELDLFWKAIQDAKAGSFAQGLVMRMAIG